MGSAWWIASRRRKPEIIKFMGLQRLSAFCKCLFVCLWVVRDEVCGCFLKPHLFNIISPQAVNLRLTSLYLFIVCTISRWARDSFGKLFGMGSVKQRISSRWAQSNIYKHVPKPLAQGTQQQIVRYKSLQATMLWTMCLDDISSCHRQCCLYCWCCVLKRFGIVCV